MSTTKKAAKKSKKRANGEGTFYQREDKTWVHQITLGRKLDGSPDRKTFTGATRGVCIERRDAYKEEKSRREQLKQAEDALQLQKLAEAEKKGHSIESEILFCEAFPEWLQLYKSPPTKKSSTYSGYLDTYRVHFKEFFGSLMLCDITQDEVQKYYKIKEIDGARNNGKPGGLSAKTIQNHHILLKDFFNYAVKKYKLADNPTKETERPQVTTRKMRVLDYDEMMLFLREVTRESQRIAIIFDLFMGLRIGELLALEVTDIDVKNQSIDIQRDVIRVSTEAIAVGDPNIRIINHKPDNKTHLIIQNFPKTKKSYRSIPIPDDIFELVVRHLFFLEQTNWPNPNNLLFPSSTGTYIDPRSYDIRLKAICERCEIPKAPSHALRRTFATRMSELKIPLATLSNLMGHASISTTQKYVAVLTEEKRTAVESLSELLRPENLISAKRLNGTKNRMRFEDMRLPSWLQTEPQAT
jgi:integrase